MSKENKCTQVPYRISIHEKYMSVDKLKSYVLMIDNVRIKKFLFDQTFDIVNVITPNKISFKELQKILLKSNVKRNQFFFKQVSSKNFIVTEKYLKFDDDELNFDQFHYFMSKYYVDLLNGDVDVNNHQKLTISSDIERIITSIKLSSSDLKKD